MKRRLTMAVASLVGLLASLAVVAVASPPAQAQSGGFQISGTNLVDANGNDFIIRGVSHPHVWYQQETESFSEIADLGANAVRVVLGSGQRWGPSSAADVANVIDQCKQNALICILEVHDTTGFGEEGAAASLDQAVSYWQSIQSVLEGEEEYVLVNIGNEPYGNQNYDPGWEEDTIDAIQTLRSSGFDHTLVVDAPNWGQDWSGTMQAAAPRVAAADPQGNTLFSIHMYGVYDSASTVIDYLDAFRSMGLPLMIGEFGHNHSDGDPDEDTIMAEAVARGIGYVGWSYSGNSGGVEYLDMTDNFDPNSLTDWGERIFHGPNGIVQTAECATVFPDCDGTPPTTTPPTTTPPTTTPPTTTPPTTTPPTTTPPTTTPPTTSPPVGGSCQVSYDANDWGGSPGFTANVTITNTGSSAIDGWTLAWSYTAGQTVDEPGWNATVSQSGSSVTATNAGWNATIAPGQSASFGFNGAATSVGNNPEPTSFTLNGSGCGVS